VLHGDPIFFSSPSETAADTKIQDKVLEGADKRFWHPVAWDLLSEVRRNPCLDMFDDCEVARSSLRE
jgi:hypothetical protein